MHVLESWIGPLRWVFAVGSGIALCFVMLTAPEAQSVSDDSPADLAGLLINVEDVGRGAEVVRSGALSGDDLFKESSGIDEIKRAHVVGGQEVLFELKEEPSARVLVRLFELRTAKWAQSLLNESAQPRRDLAPDGREAISSDDGISVSFVQATRGRLVLAIFVVPTDTQVAADSLSIRNLRDDLFKVQYGRLPQLGDLANASDSPVVAVANQMATYLGFGAAGLFVTVAALSGFASIVRDRGSGELARSVFGPKRGPKDRNSNIPVIDHSSTATRAGRQALLWWAARTAVLASLLGLLLWWPRLSPWWAMAIFALILVGIAMGKAYVKRRANSNDIRMSSRELVIVGLGAAGTALIFTGGVGIMAAGIIGMWMGAGAGLLVIIPMALLGVSVMVGSRKFSRVARRLIQPAIRRRVDEDQRPPTLLLRSFADDSLEVRSSAVTDSFAESLAGEAYAHFEEGVAWALWRSGPVLTVGQPDTFLQPLGAARDYYSDDDWQEAIVERMHAAPVIALVVGRSPSLRWEIAQIQQNGYLAKSIFILPPVPKVEFQLRMKVLCASLGLTDSILNNVDQAWPILLAFDSRGVPILHVSRARTTSVYVDAIRAGATLAAHQSGTRLSLPDASYRGFSSDVDNLLEAFDPTQQKKPRKTIASILADVAIRI